MCACDYKEKCFVYGGVSCTGSGSESDVFYGDCYDEDAQGFMDIKVSAYALCSTTGPTQSWCHCAFEPIDGGADHSEWSYTQCDDTYTTKLNGGTYDTKTTCYPFVVQPVP